MPGKNKIVFLKGITLDGMGKSDMAVREYNKYLQKVSKGGAASHARQWGYVQ